jgi:predicted ATP-dependent endonuclease of OLD family
MSEIRINSISIKNYRSFGNEEQFFVFPNIDYKKPIAIVGYNNAGKTNLMNVVLYGIGGNYVNKDTFEINDFHNKKIENIPEFVLDVCSSIENKYDGKNADLNGKHQLVIQIDGNEIAGAKIESLKHDGSLNYQAYGALRYYNVFYINFHKIKEEISTQKTSWGNLKSFLAKHIKKIVDSDDTMKVKKTEFEKETKLATKKVLKDSKLSEFILEIKKNYSTNLRNNNCEVDFGLPDYEDIFLQMMFKVGLNGDRTNYVPISHFGDGYISMFVMAVIQAIAESETNDKCLFLFEEPESFLHENHQEYFYKMVLCQLAEKGHQVIYTTHSDKMVDIFDTKGLIRLEFDDEKNRQ